MSIPCALNHVAYGRHAPGCTCTHECPDHENHCTGCLPVEATDGLLCSTDRRRLAGYLGAEQGLDPDHPVHGIPWAYDHLADAYPSLSQAPGGGGTGPEDREAERLSSVLSLRSDMHRRLRWWTFELMTLHGLAGPDLPSSERAERIEVRRCAEWLLKHLESLTAHPAVADASEELGDLTSRAHALAPWRPAPTHLDGIPCRCGATALHDHSDEIVCWSCRRAYSRDEYGILTKVFARRYEDDERGRRAIARPRMETSSAGTGGRP